MRIAISGPPGSKKTEIMLKLKTNPWFVKNNFNFNKIDISKHENDKKESQFFIFNDIVNGSVVPSMNSIQIYSPFDPFAHAIHYSYNGEGSIETTSNLLVAATSLFKIFDLIFYIRNENSDMSEAYDKTSRIFKYNERIKIIDSKNANAVYNNIISTVTEVYAKAEEEKNEKSAKLSPALNNK